MMAAVADGPLEGDACVRLDREKGEVPDCVDPSLKGDVYACESPPPDHPKTNQTTHTPKTPTKVRRIQSGLQRRRHGPTAADRTQ